MSIDTSGPNAQAFFRVSGLDAACMDTVYRPLRRGWLAHARPSLADIAAVLDARSQ